ncbi:hypothetical protein FIBSPDRAFT_1051898 [Athelia psychrophila]|uniref:F-box domain-containing protein n=1 Tax=Athelia psychrophila TaxID=1759441 RepID=A0A165Y8Q4_9AGAM|nr:hypothetical protein FIBSPDRAFT_1051898 [Fibularhizoctonia sp. CBS 109695]
MRRLAPETVDNIIDCLHADKPALFACSLTVKQWLPSTRFHIFEGVHLRPTNIEKFAGIVEVPSSTLPLMMRHLLINGFSKSMLQYSGADKDALGLLRRVSPLLREVTYLHLCNSGKVAADSDILSKIGNSKIQHLSLSQDMFNSMDDAFRVIYSFPLLKSLSIKSIFVSQPSMKPLEHRHHPGPDYNPSNPAVFEIRCLKGTRNNCNMFIDWLSALQPIPDIRDFNFQAYDPRVAPVQQHILQLRGSLISSIDVDVGYAIDGMEDSPAFVDLSGCSSLRTLRLQNICLRDTPPIGTRWARKLISQMSSSKLEEITFSFHKCTRPDGLAMDDPYLHIRAFDWRGVHDALESLELGQLRRLTIEILPVGRPGDKAQLETFIKTSGLQALAARGLVEFRYLHRYYMSY